MGEIRVAVEIFICFVVIVGELGQLVGAVESIGLVALGVIRGGDKVALGIVGVGAARLVKGHHQIIEIRGVRLTVEHYEEADTVYLFIGIGGKDVALVLLGRGIVVKMNVVPLEMIAEYWINNNTVEDALNCVTYKLIKILYK